MAPLISDPVEGLPDYLVDMVRRQPPDDRFVVAGSTPVVSFGDPLKARVATLAINPSVREFIEHGRPLVGAKRRLATLESLGLDSMDEASDEQVATVVAECNGYFHRNPYRVWFGPLDEILRVATGCSYWNGDACHLDLVQWATDPIWGKIPSAEVRSRLLADGVLHLRNQLAASPLEVVLLNGKTVIEHVIACGLAGLDVVGDIADTSGQKTRQWLLYDGQGQGQGTRFLGWSCNLQSSFLRGGFAQRLGEWARDRLGTEDPGTSATRSQSERSDPRTRSHRPAQPASDPGSAGEYLPRGTTVTSKSELADLLSNWLATSTAATIGEVGTYGGSALVTVELGDATVLLNADTKRASVEKFLAHRNVEGDWTVISNRKGRWTLVTFNQDGTPVPGWYCYLESPAEGRMIL
jgi:hypothetical protein